MIHALLLFALLLWCMLSNRMRGGLLPIGQTQPTRLRFGLMMMLPAAALNASPWWCVIVGLGALLSCWAPPGHGEYQRTRDTRDVLMLCVSGFTCLGTVSLVALGFHWWMAEPLGPLWIHPLVGLLKGPAYLLGNTLLPSRLGQWLSARVHPRVAELLTGSEGLFGVVWWLDMVLTS